jgi:hypothetical protein
MLLLNLILLIDVTFSTPTPVYNYAEVQSLSHDWFTTIWIAEPIDDPEVSVGYRVEQFLQCGQQESGNWRCRGNRNRTGNPRSGTWRRGIVETVDADFEDRLIAFDPKLVKQVPDVELTPGNFSQTRGVPQDVVLMGDRVRYDRKKVTSSTPRALLRDWWNQVCWTSGANSITNRGIVLGLANKDGGAHVDGSGYPNYRKAKQQGQMFFGQQLSNIAKMGHLAAVAGDQLKAFITEKFSEEPNEVKDTEGRRIQ